MSVQIQGLAPRSLVSEAGVRGGTGLELYGAFGTYALVLGGTTYVYVAAHEDNGISVFRLGADGSLSSVQNLSDSGANTGLELVGASQIVSATVGGSTYLYVNSAIDDGLAAFRVNADGTLASIQNITDDATLELNGPEGKMTVATVEGVSYLVSPGDDDNGIGVFRINADGTLTSTFTLTDTSLLQLHSASDTAVVVGADGLTYVYVAAEDDPGLSVFRLQPGGTLQSVQNIPDTAVLELGGTAGLATATVDGVTYLIASGAVDDGLSVFRIGPTGQISNVFNITDTAALGLDGAMGMSTFTIDAETYVAVSAMEDDALSIFHVEAGGALTHVTTLFDTDATTLNGTYFNSFVTVGGTPYLIATGRYDNGVTVLEVVLDGGSTPNSPPTDITVSGGTVQENAAAGTVVATLGALDPDAGDTFTYGMTGETGPFVIVGNQIRVAATAQIDYETKTSYTLDITVTDSRGNTYGEQLVVGVQDVVESTNPPIVGTSAANTLTGTSGSDDIWGREGNDILNGLAGSDRLYGEAGNDTLDGGPGSDTMVGGVGADTYVVDDAADTITEASGQGVDTVRTSLGSYSLDTAANVNVENLNYSGSTSFSGIGNALNNTLLGGTLNDVFDGRGGNDIFKAGNGADTLTGGAGADDFVFLAIANSKIGTGMDHILDFAAGEDDIVVTNIDANTAVTGNQNFLLDDDASFSAGEIRQTVVNGNLLIEFNVDADSTVEMAVLLEGRTSTLGATDFDL